MGGYGPPSMGSHVYLLEVVSTGTIFLLLGILAKEISIRSWEPASFLVSGMF